MVTLIFVPLLFTEITELGGFELMDRKLSQADKLGFIKMT